MKRPLALSTICISAGFAVVAVATVVVAAIVVAAATVTAAAQDGCFARDFDAAHLEAHPEQVVERLALYFSEDAVRPGVRFVEITARMARQGHALRRGAGGMAMEEFASCTPEGLCTISCDGGTFLISRFDGDMVEIQTADARVSAQPCNPNTVVSILSDAPGEIATFQLSQAPDGRCGR